MNVFLLLLKIKANIIKSLFMAYLLVFAPASYYSSYMSSSYTHFLIPGPGMLLPTVL